MWSTFCYFFKIHLTSFCSSFLHNKLKPQKNLDNTSSSTNELLKIEKLFSNTIGACVNTGYIY